MGDSGLKYSEGISRLLAKLVAAGEQDRANLLRTSPALAMQIVAGGRPRLDFDPASRFTQSQSFDAPPLTLPAVLAWLSTASPADRAAVHGASGEAAKDVAGKIVPKAKSPDLNVRGRTAAGGKKGTDSGGEKR